MPTASLNSVQIDLAAVRHNYQRIRQQVGDRVRVMAMVKSDAYGHGLAPVAKALAEAGARTFGVAEVEEGCVLRRQGVGGDIIVLLGAPPDAVEEVVRHQLSPVVYDLEGLAGLSAAADRAGAQVGVHLKVDIGMGRLGVMPEDAPAFAEEIERLPGVFMAGLFSHFPLADAPLPDKTVAQCRAFEEMVSRINEIAGSRRIVHIANSAALIRYPQTHFDMVRPGITLYGCYPSREDAGRDLLGLRPAMRFSTRVLQVKEVGSGFGLSYGHLYATKRPSRLAVLPVGYDDGYLRRLTGRAQVLIRGRRAPVRGMICMNACIADVTDLSEVRPGDEVVLMGRQGEETISADEIAGWMETISYEVCCLFGGRNRRVYLG